MPRVQYPDMQDPAAIVQWLWFDMCLSDEAMARLAHCSRSAIWHIRNGQQSGRNLLPRLQNIVIVIAANARGMRVRA